VKKRKILHSKKCFRVTYDLSRKMFIVEREKKNIKKKACFLTSLLPIDHGCFILFSGVFYLVVFHCSCCSYWKKDGLIRLDRVEGMHSVSRGADTWGHFHLIRLS